MTKQQANDLFEAKMRVEQAFEEMASAGFRRNSAGEVVLDDETGRLTKLKDPDRREAADELVAAQNDYNALVEKLTS